MYSRLFLNGIYFAILSETQTNHFETFFKNTQPFFPHHQFIIVNHLKQYLETPLEIIIQGCRRQNIQSQQQLYKLFYPEMIKTCHRYAGDADGAGSIYNNAMLKVFKSIDTYSEEGKLSGWIKTIVVNCCIDFCKKKNIFRNSTSYISEDEITMEPEVFNTVSYKEVQQIIAQLPGATATVFRLFVYEGLTHKQIGGHLDISEGTSKWHVSEAKKMLKKKFEMMYENKLTVNAAK